MAEHLFPAAVRARSASRIRRAPTRKSAARRPKLR
jgi:hypothetical protein